MDDLTWMYMGCNSVLCFMCGAMNASPNTALMLREYEERLPLLRKTVKLREWVQCCELCFDAARDGNVEALLERAITIHFFQFRGETPTLEIRNLLIQDFKRMTEANFHDET